MLPQKSWTQTRHPSKWFHPQSLVHWQLQPIQDKQFFKWENCLKWRGMSTIKTCQKISPKLGAIPTKNSCFRNLHHPRLAHVKTDGIPGTSCRLKPDFTLSEFYFFSFTGAADNFDKSFVCPGGVWLGCGFRWGVRRSSLNAIFGATWFRGLGGLGGSTIKSLISSLRQTATGLKKRKKDRNILLMFWEGEGGGCSSQI